MASIGLLLITRDNNLICAHEAITRTIAGLITFGEYRALTGLLEHLRFVAKLRLTPPPCCTGRTAERGRAEMDQTRRYCQTRSCYEG